MYDVDAAMPLSRDRAAAPHGSSTGLSVGTPHSHLSQVLSEVILT